MEKGLFTRFGPFIGDLDRGWSFFELVLVCVPERREKMMRILTIDDSRTIREMLNQTLSEAGFEVLQAEDGQRGLEILESEKNIDIVITDTDMPVMGGIEFIRKVRAHGEYDALPILLLTHETHREKRDEAHAAGGTGWIVKPFNSGKLIDVIRRLVR